MRLLNHLLPPPKGGRLARRVVRAFRRHGVAEPFDYDPESHMVIGRESGLRVNLGNLQADVALQWPWRRAAVIDRFAGVVAPGGPAIPDDFGEARPRLLPNLRDAATWEVMRLDAALAGHEVTEIPFVEVSPRLRAALYLDAEHGMGMVTADVLERWSVGFEEALELALGNLRARSAVPFERLAAGVWAGPWHDCYDTARILLPDLLRPLEVEGETVVLCPHWNLLLVTGSRDAAGLRACMELAGRQIKEAPKTMSAQPLVQRPGHWWPMEFPHGHELQAVWRRARVIELVGLYEEQMRLLQPWYEREGHDVYVAKYTASEHRETGDVTSWCVWGRGVDALLPETDTVMLYDDDLPEDERVVRLDWDLVQRQCRELMEPTPHLPARWRVRSYPPAQVVAKMVETQQRRERTGGTAVAAVP